MGKRRFEDILEECLEAVARGEATRQECLMRYPQQAGELGPCLMLAQRLRQAYAVEADERFQQALQQRLLAEAAARARAAAPRWRRPALAWATGLAAAALMAAVTLGVLLAGGLSSSSPAPVRVHVRQIPPPTIEQALAPAADMQPSPSLVAALARLEHQLRVVQQRAEQTQGVEPALIRDLKESTASVVQRLQEPPSAQERPDIAKAAQLTAQQQEVLNQIKDAVSEEAASDLEETVAIAQQGQLLAQAVLATTPEPSPTATPTPAP